LYWRKLKGFCGERMLVLVSKLKGDIVERVAPGVTGLHLQRPGNAAAELGGEAVVVRDAGIRDFSHGRESRVERSHR
jgi:hypothetical protein